MDLKTALKEILVEDIRKHGSLDTRRALTNVLGEKLANKLLENKSERSM